MKYVWSFITTLVILGLAYGICDYWDISRYWAIVIGAIGGDLGARIDRALGAFQWGEP